MQKWTAVPLTIYLLLVLAACGQNNSSLPSSPTAELDDPIGANCPTTLQPSAPTIKGQYVDKDGETHLPLPPVPDGATGLNLLILMTEDQGAHSGAYGTPGLKTPNLDRLAEMGARYKRAYITIASCSPAKTALFTGLYNHVNGVLSNVQEFVGSYEELQQDNPPWFSDPNSNYNTMALQTKEPTLVEILKHAGYYTGVDNKFHRPSHNRYPFDRWEKWRGGSLNHYQQVASFIEQAQSLDQPWFLEHNISITHRPWPQNYQHRIDQDVVEPPGHLPDTETIRQDWSKYLCAIEYADQMIGAALQALEDSGEMDKTIIVMLGDHGVEYHRGKFTTYNLGLQVPLLIRGPGVEPGSVEGALFSSVDLLPTLLDFLGLETVGRLDGVSHYARLTGQTDEGPRNYLVGLANSDRSITVGRYKLIFMADPSATLLPKDTTDVDPWQNPVYEHIVDNQNVPGFEAAYRLLDLADSNLKMYTRPRFELYNLGDDPWEINDLAENSNYSETLECMKLMLTDWMDGYGDNIERP